MNTDFLHFCLYQFIIANEGCDDEAEAIFSPIKLLSQWKETLKFDEKLSKVAERLNLAAERQYRTL